MIIIVQPRLFLAPTEAPMAALGKSNLSCDVVVVDRFSHRALCLNERISKNNHLIGKLTKIITSHGSFQSPMHACGPTDISLANTGVCEKTYLFCASLCTAKQQQKLLSGP